MSQRVMAAPLPPNLSSTLPPKSHTSDAPPPPSKIPPESPTAHSSRKSIINLIPRGVVKIEPDGTESVKFGVPLGLVPVHYREALLASRRVAQAAGRAAAQVAAAKFLDPVDSHRQNSFRSKRKSEPRSEDDAPPLSSLPQLGQIVRSPQPTQPSASQSHPADMPLDEPAAETQADVPLEIQPQEMGDDAQGEWQDVPDEPEEDQENVPPRPRQYPPAQSPVLRTPSLYRAQQKRQARFKSKERRRKISAAFLKLQQRTPSL